MIKIGDLGEKLVAQYLQSQDWEILHQGWHCLWGEIDIIAEKKSSNELIFVEVKARRQNNWDNDGLLAITSKKQLKISRTAASFLTKNIAFANYFCRFDVALVSYQKQSAIAQTIYAKSTTLIESGYQFTLKQYLESAFDLSIEQD
jgi:putative endonuclease